MANLQSEARLSVWEATSIIIGHSIGGGIMAVPFLASMNSYTVVLCIILAAFVLNVIQHLMVAELSYNCGGGQIVSCFQQTLFCGKGGKVLTAIVFAVFGFSVVVNIAGYIIGAADAIVALFPAMPYWLAKVVFFALAGSVVFLGMKAVGIAEKYTVLVIYAVIFVLAGATCFTSWQPLPTTIQSANAPLALFGMVMFALLASQSVIQAVKGLNGDRKKVRLSITLGIGLDAVLVLVLTTVTLLGSKGAVTELALLGLSRGIGSWAIPVGSLFTLLALATTFWSSSLNLRDIVHEQFNTGLRVSWLIATAPSFVAALTGVGSFLSLTRLVSVIAIISNWLLLAAYGISRRRADSSPYCGKLGSWPVIVLVFVVSCVACYGSLVSI